MALTRPSAAQINTTTLDVTDPLFRINKNQSGVNDKDIGLVLERGSDTNVAFIWDESADEFVLINTTETGTTSGNVTISSYADLQVGTINTSSLEISGTAVTSTATELNILDGVTATATEINYLGGVTSAIQTQIDNISSSFTLAADSGVSDTFTTGQTLTFTGGTGIDTTVSDNQISVAIDSTVATLTGTQTLTNKTLRAPAFEGGSNAPEFIETRYVNATQMDFVQLYTGASSGSYFTQGEYQKIATIIPDGDSQNYTFRLRMTATSASNYQIVEFTGALRSNTLPDLDFTSNYFEEHNGIRFIEPKLWTKETTTAGFILAFEYVHNANLYGGVNVEATIIPRSDAQRANVTFNTTQNSEQSSIDAGYTENNPTLIYANVSGTLEFGTQFRIEGSTSDGNELTITATDPTADRTITFPDATGTIALTSDITLSTLSVTATAAELNILDGVTSTTAELNILDGVTATATEINRLDGISSAAVGISDTQTLTNKTLTSPVVTTDIRLNAQAELEFFDSDSSHYVSFRAPATVASSVTWTLPASDGTADQVLATNGAGTLSWADAGAGGGSGSSYPNSTFQTVPGTDGNFDLSYNVAQTTQETPFEASGTDAFGVNLGSVFDSMDPVGTLDSIDYGSGEAYLGA